MIAAVKGITAPQSRFGALLVLFVHNRYRTIGGEERAVAELMTLVREELGEEAELLERDSAQLGRGRAARGLLRGGLDPDDVGAAVRRTGARIVHAHNLLPSFGPRATPALASSCTCTTTGSSAPSAPVSTRAARTASGARTATRCPACG